MPELPEVETIRRGLARRLIGKRIARVEVSGAKQLQGNRRLLIGAQIVGLQRRAKILILEIKNSLVRNSQIIYLAIHLKMSGQLIYAPRNTIGKVLRQKGLIIGGHPENAYLEQLPNKYTRIIVTFGDGSHLYFNDLRRFGWFRVVDEDGLQQLIAQLGPEALSITTKSLAAIIATGRGPRIKQFLLDQTNIAGLGNIYVDESLFCAKINPLKLIKNLQADEIRRLARCIPAVLRLSLKHGGTSIQHFRNSAGKVGTFGKVAKIYGRLGQPCVRCRTPVKKQRVAGRGTHYCPKCQA